MIKAYYYVCKYFMPILVDRVVSKSILLLLCIEKKQMHSDYVTNIPCHELTTRGILARHCRDTTVLRG